MNVELIVSQGGGRTKKLQLHHETTVIGRRRDCNICIPSSEVSRRHCMLRFHDGYLTVEDLKSINGTFLNDQKIADKTVVYPGDRLAIGPVHFTVRYELSPEARELLQLPQDAGDGDFQFEVVAVEEEDPTIKMDADEPGAVKEDFEIIEDVGDSQVVEIVDDPELIELVEDAEPVEEVEDAEIIEIVDDAEIVEKVSSPPKKKQKA
jgi:predicted component of type VI protein secretion system